MNTIATFFAGLMAFVSGLFGHHVTPTSTSPTPVTQQVTSTSSIQTQTTTTQEILNQSNENEEEYIPNNIVKAVIKKTFDDPVYIYVTKDKNVVYFIKRSEKDGSLPCVDLEYFDIKENKFGVIKDGYCPRSLDSISPPYDPKKILPLHIQEGSFNFRDTYNKEGILNKKDSDLYVLNLETRKRALLYSNNNPNESLIAGCYYLPATYEFLGSLPYLEYTDTNQLKIGVYKNIGQNSKQCKHDGKSGYSNNIKIEEYEKIRDDIIDLKKIR